MKFSKFEFGLYILIANAMDSNENLIGHEYSDGYRANIILVGDKSDPIQVVFSFPRESDDCYLMITDGSPVELAKEMAALQEYNENVSHLCKGHTVPTENKYLNDAGWYSYLITSPHISFREFPLTQKVDGREIRFHLALPLTNREMGIKIKNGMDVLINDFISKNRDTITFDQSHNKAN